MHGLLFIAMATFVWFFLKTTQTLLIVFTKSKIKRYLLVSFVSLSTSIVWIMTVRKLAVSTDLLTVLVYSVFSTLGIDVGMLVNEKYREE